MVRPFKTRINALQELRDAHQKITDLPGCSANVQGEGRPDLAYRTDTLSNI